MTPGDGNLTALALLKLVCFGKGSVLVFNCSSFKFIQWASEAECSYCQSWN